jgi:hypothetical protein
MSSHTRALPTDAKEIEISFTRCLTSPIKPRLTAALSAHDSLEFLTMAVLTFRDNDALDVNPPDGDQYLSKGGSNWLWAVMAIFALTFVSNPDPVSVHWQS